jgi:hypothetical protein
VTLSHLLFFETKKNSKIYIKKCKIHSIIVQKELGKSHYHDNKKLALVWYRRGLADTVDKLAYEKRHMIQYFKEKTCPIYPVIMGPLLTN